MDKLKKLIFLNIPLSICNLRCHYCYIAQRKECYQGVQPKMEYTPIQVAHALSKDRIGGAAFINICAKGETMLLKDLDKYVEALLKEGHYIELVTNLTVTSMVDKILSISPLLLKHLEFKCSFHYLELKKKGWLDLFANNVSKIKKSGASYTIEMVPNDEVIPYIDEIKEFSLENFKALPHLTIARNDGKKDIGYLTKLSIDEYDKVWGQFNSGFWEYKKSIFMKKQKDFCYAGLWSMHIDMSTGVYKQCLRSIPIGNVFMNPEKKLPELPVCSCHLAHCYNGHALLTMGLIPNSTDVGFGDIRNRVCNDGSEWLQPELKSFFNQKLKDSNEMFSASDQIKMRIRMVPFTIARRIALLSWLGRMKKQ